MSEWWTYTLSDFLLFSARTYYRLFELYNLAIWPAQSVALALGSIVLALLWRLTHGRVRLPDDRDATEVTARLTAEARRRGQA